MKILMLRTNKVDPDPRVEKEANSLIKNKDIDLTIHAWDRTSKHKCVKETLNLINGEVPIYRIGIKGNWGKGMKKNIIPALKYEIYLFFWLLKNIKKYDIIHAFDLMTGYPALFPVKLFKKKLVYDCCDYYADSQKGPEIIMKKLRKIETKVFEKADYSIICSEKRIEQIKPANPRKMFIIHNSPNINDYNINKKEQTKIIKSNSNRLKFVYVGNFCNDRWLLEFLNEAKKNSDEIEVHIGGFGGLNGQIKKLSEKADNIFMYGKMKYSDVLQLEREGDCLVAFYETHLKNHIYAAPNKFYEALAIGKPLMMLKGSGMSEIVEKGKIGAVIEPNGDSFKEGIKKIKALKKDKSLKKKMNNIFKKEFSWEIMEKRLFDLYEELKEEML